MARRQGQEERESPRGFPTLGETEQTAEEERDWLLRDDRSPLFEFVCVRARCGACALSAARHPFSAGHKLRDTLVTRCSRPHIVVQLCTFRAHRRRAWLKYSAYTVRSAYLAGARGASPSMGDADAMGGDISVSVTCERCRSADLCIWEVSSLGVLYRLSR